MNEKTTNAIHWSFWVIGIVALVWNILGSINFFMHMNPDVLASYRASERVIVEGRPLWATGGFALAVFGGTLGCLLLLLRRSAAYYTLIASCLGVLVTMTHTLSMGIDFGTGEIVGILFMPLAVAAFLVWYAKYAELRGWIVKTSS